jgi:inhibitor of KinA
VPSRKKTPYLIKTASDRALLADFGGDISEATERQAASLASRLRKVALPGVLAIQPAYTSVLVKFDPARLERAQLEQALSELADSGGERVRPSEHVIPVCYEGEYAPDLEEVARTLGLSAKKVIALHSGKVYRVCFLGFLPGFAYLTGLPKELEVQRVAEARLRVPRGSVGIAGGQTGVYPVESPGGWRLIGRTPLSLLDWTRDPPALLSAGDTLRFEPISKGEFERHGG